MEKSKLISNLIAKLKVAYPYYFDKLNNDMFLGLVALYQEHLSSFNEQTLKKAFNSIIHKNKFMPSLSEIIEECEKNITYNRNYVIEKMIDNGYFTNSREIEKTYHFLEEGIIPKWLQKDMREYEQRLLAKENLKMIGE